MEKYVFSYVSLISISLLPLLSYADSYMFCVNSDNHFDWKWAPPIPLEEYNHWGFGNPYIPRDEKGIRISGSLDFNKNTHPVLHANVNKENFSKFRAKSFCDKLKKQCLKLGSQYSLIGVAKLSIPAFSWGYISVQYDDATYEDKNGYHIVTRIKKTAACPNWDFPSFPNEGGSLGFFN
ncbi:hypothetical protein [Fluviispira multicolorata]|uniref:Uncharacterized protein n=1 Tax=Fluviispira multicolorata TaxID=2654512 RepID=A0A833JDG3_9BACT|nr:hypothetical protein [Fluviispira multicolorata]KAB8031893.1 hypothetical protein GCL57_04415 [Fluviispira multicolorata]